MQLVALFAWNEGVGSSSLSTLTTIWVDGWVVEGSGLQNRLGNPRVGSNPTLPSHDKVWNKLS